MFAWDIAFWFCCLNPRERGVLRATIDGEIATLGVGIPLDVWNTFWIASPDNGTAVREAFLRIFRLEIVTIEIGDPPVPVDVVAPIDYAQWLSWGLFLLTPSAACLSGCQQSTVP